MKNDKITITGHTNQKVKYITVGEYKVELNQENRFELEYPIVEVDNHISIKVVDLNDNVIYEEGRVVYYDKTLPMLQLNTGYIDENNVIHTNQNPVTVKGSLSDNGEGYRAYMNGNELMVLEYNSSLGNEHSLRTFEKTMPIQDKDKLQFEVNDSVGNTFTRVYEFNLDQVKPVISVTGIQDNQLLLPDKISITSNEKGTLRYSLDGLPFNLDDKVKPGNHLLVVEATDLAGNVTREEIEFTAVNKYNAKQVKPIQASVDTYPDLTNVLEVKDYQGNAVQVKSVNVVGAKPQVGGNTTLKVMVVLVDNTILETSVDVKYVYPARTLSSNGVKVENVVSEKLVSLVVERLSKAVPGLGSNAVLYDIYFVDENQNLVDIGTSEYKVTIAKDSSQTAINVYYVDDVNNKHAIAFTQDDQNVYFNTTHFSNYAVEYEPKVSVQPISTSTQNTKLKADVKSGNVDNTLLYVLTLITSASLFIFVRKRKY